MSTDKEKLAGISSCLTCMDVMLRCTHSVTVDDVKAVVNQIRSIMSEPDTKEK